MSGARGAGEAISVHQLLLGAFRCPDRPIIATESPICTRKPLVGPIWWSTNPCEPATGRQCPFVGPICSLAHLVVNARVTPIAGATVAAGGPVDRTELHPPEPRWPCPRAAS